MKYFKKHFLTIVICLIFFSIDTITPSFIKHVNADENTITLNDNDINQILTNQRFFLDHNGICYVAFKVPVTLKRISDHEYSSATTWSITAVNVNSCYSLK